MDTYKVCLRLKNYCNTETFLIFLFIVKHTKISFKHLVRTFYENEITYYGEVTILIKLFLGFIDISDITQKKLITTTDEQFSLKAVYKCI